MISYPNAQGCLQEKPGCFEEAGTALLMVLLAISVFSLLGLFMALDAVNGLYISDNHENRVQATSAALAGLNHARALMRGLEYDAILKGMDGVYSRNPSYLKEAKSYRFRSPFSMDTAHSLDILDPSAALSRIPDDGLINTGARNGKKGIPLIPVTGIVQKAPNPAGPGEVVTSRYFVKVTDNNGDVSERAKDAGDNPFVDGDGLVIVRSMGIAETFFEAVGPVWRRNSVVVFEARYRKFSVFDFGPALLVLGSRVSPHFSGTYGIAGGAFPGIGVIDTDMNDNAFPEKIIRTAPLGHGNISGGGSPNPAVRDITHLAGTDPERSPILDPQYLWDFVFHQAPRFSDNYSGSDQRWNPANAPDLGSYDASKPANAQGQDPKLTVVHGNLLMTGNVSGAGLLIVTGDFLCTGDCHYTGLVLVLGSGRIGLHTSGSGMNGGLVVANLEEFNGNPVFGVPEFSISGNSRIRTDTRAVGMALGLIPPIQKSFREIAGTDP
ncbi:MAG: hypothetical protein JXR49_01605 [Acidobacteria bacterium]|nr:hypothetical protein [Acidobacteriota bacterium]